MNERRSARRDGGTPETFRVVCLGGSSGALAGYRTILRAIPPDSGMAFIVVGHRRPGSDHLLTPLLEAVTAMPVSAIRDGQRVSPNTVAFLGADKNLSVAAGRLVLSARANPTGWPRTITQFLESLAAEVGTRAVAVILSGLDGDGSAALAAIKGAGGITFAQRDAQCPDMPRSAVATGHVDFLLSSGEIGEALADLSRKAS